MAEQPRSTPLAEAFERAILALSAPGVSYALIGGLAVACRGLPRPTRDIDVLFSSSRIQLPRLLQRLAERGYSFEMPEILRRLSEDHLATVRYRGVRLDLLEAILPVFSRVLQNATEVEIEGCRVRVASATDLTILKLLAGRDDDIRDVRGIVGVQRGRLDLEAIRRGVEECGAEDRLEILHRLLRQAPA